MIEYVEFRLNSPFGQVLLPDFTTATLDVKYNDAGVIEFGYPTKEAGQLGLRDQSSVSAILGIGDDSIEVDRYIISGTSDTVVSDSKPTTTFTGDSVIKSLNDAVVYPSNWPVTAPSGHEFIDATFGTIWRTLILRAKNRGALLDVTETSFSGTKDSSGADWTFLHSKVFETGKKYFTLLQELMEGGLIDAWMDPDMNLQIVNGGTRGSVIDIGTVEIKPAKNIADLTIATQSSESASVLLMEGEEGTSVERTDAFFESQLGRRRETFLAQSGVADGGILDMLAEKALEIAARIPTEETVGITNGLTPFLDFNVGDWVHVRYKTDEDPQTRRVRQLAISVDEGRTISLGCTLGTIIYEADVALQRQFDAYAGSGGTVLNNAVPDTTVPNPPSGLGITTNAYTTSAGVTAAAFTANWLAPSTNTGGDAYTDADGYYVNWRYTTDTAWHGEVRTTDPRFQVGSLSPGLEIEVSVVAVDQTGHRSAPVTKTATLAFDATPPAKPATPVGASRLGSVQVFWSGLTSTGAPQPKDFLYAELHEMTDATTVPAPGAATRRGSFVGAGTVTLTDLSYNSTRYYRVLAVDRSGNWSPASDASAGVVVKALVNTDLIGEIIAGANLLPNTVTYKNLAIGDFENFFIEFDKEANRAKYVPTTGFSWEEDNTATALWRLKVAPSANTGNHHMALGDPVPVNPGDEFWIRTETFRVFANYPLNVGFRALDKNGAVVSYATGDQGLALSTSSSTTVWETSTKALTVPMNPAITHIVPEVFAATLNVSNVGGLWLIKNPTLRRRNAGNLIVDGAITTPKLAALAVEAGKIAANAVTTSKLAFGAATGDRIHISNKGFAVNDNSNMEEEAVDAAGAPLGRPAYWTAQMYPTSGVLSIDNSGTVVSGTRSAKVTVPAGETSRLWYQPSNSDYIPVVAGEKWFISAKFRRVGGGAWLSGASSGLRPTVVGATTSASTPHPYLTAGSVEHWGAQSEVPDDSGVHTRTSVFTIPNGHTRLGFSVYLPAYTSEVQWILDEVVAHPAIDDSKVTDITPGRITTGVLAANTRIIAGTESGARAELNTAGFSAFNSSGVKTFEVRGSDGAVYTAGTFTTVSGNGNGRVQIGAYELETGEQAGQMWNTIQFYPNNTDWDPATVWAAYGEGSPNWGVLEFTGPRLGTRAPARFSMRSEEQTNQTSITMTANTFIAKANLYTWGDPTNGVVTFRLAPASGLEQRLSFQSAGLRRLEFRYDTSFNQIVSQNSAGAFSPMEFAANVFKFAVVGTSGDLDIGPSTGQNDRVALRTIQEGFSGSSLVFGTENLYVKTWNGSNYAPIYASNTSAPSDIEFKKNVQEHQDTDILNKIRSLMIHMYQMKDSTDQRNLMGLIAQHIEAVFPDAVVRPEGDDRMFVDTYYLLSVVWLGMQSLIDDVRELQNQ